jgi:hypothetical protein
VGQRRKDLEFVHELVERRMDFNNLATELVLDVVHFCMNGWNVPIYLGMKGSKVSTQFLVGFFLVGGSHEGMRGGPRGKKKRLKMIGITMIKAKRGIQ